MLDECLRSSAFRTAQEVEEGQVTDTNECQAGITLPLGKLKRRIRVHSLRHWSPWEVRLDCLCTADGHDQGGGPVEIP